jgi:pyridoxal phosphate-dependent aminotransferase EpsN
MSGHEQEYVNAAFASNWLSTVGPNLDAFEAEMAERLGGRATLAVSSGTAAMHLVLRSAGVGPGDRVGVSSLTFAGSVWPINYLGATPVFFDSEDVSGNIDPGLVAEHFKACRRSGQLPKALIVVHLYGQHADLDRLGAICDEYGVVMIEDAAESLGATYRTRQTATTAPLAILSFNGNKMITTTGGGMVVGADAAAVAKMRKWANQSREPAVEYLHREIGYNYRMSNVLAGIGRGQLKVLDQRVRERRSVFDRYRSAFIGLPVRMQDEASWGTHSRWLTVAYVDPGSGLAPNAIVSAMAERNIEARPVWRPMHTQPIYEGAPSVGGGVAERLFTTGICLPSSSSLSEDDQDRVISAFRAVFP